MTLDKLLVDHEVIICCGSGGVGKTTTAAVIALEGARRGRRACVVTIDPAKRLADTLGPRGADESADRDRPCALGRRRSRFRRRRPTAALFALMLDTKSTFDRLVHA